MTNPLITSCLAVLAVVSMAAEGIALHRLRHPGPFPGRLFVQGTLVALIGIVSAALFVLRWQSSQWQPLKAHLDGLLLLAVLFSAVILHILLRPKLRGLSAFTLPLLTLILAWGICAAEWSYHPFELTAIWAIVHLAGTYVGTFFAAGAAISGGMYVYVQRLLKTKRMSIGAGPGQLASLETLEGVVVRTASLGFVLLSLGLASGLVIGSEDPGEMGPEWWYSFKTILAVIAWAIYALVMNVRHTSRFRGGRAAWLSMVGFLLLLAVYVGITQSSDTAKPNNITPDGQLPAPPVTK